MPGYAEYTYNENSWIENITYENGVQTTFSYDCLCGRPTHMYTAKNGNSLLDLFYSYDAAGNITQLENGIFNPDMHTFEIFTAFYSYDWLNRLISETDSLGSSSYTYDSVGNRISSNGIEYVYNSVNELISMSDGTTFTYDENGNLVKKAGATIWTYQYDCKDQLIQVQLDGQTIGQYMYGGDGKRIQKMEWLESMQTFQITTYMYRGFDILYEKNTDTGMDALLVYGPTGRIAKKAGGAVHYYHTDHLGSTRLVTDDNGTVVSQVVYQSFGLSANRGDPEKYSFAGKEKDASGLFYFGARYYDSEVGRFISRDPRLGELQNPQSLNRYVYCLNNPHRYKDIWGLSESPVNESCDCLDDVEIELSQLEKLEENMGIAQTELDMALEAIERGRYEELLEDCLDFLNDIAWQIPAIFDDKRDVDLVDLAMNAFWEYIQWVSEPFMFAYGLAKAFYCTSRLWQYKMYLKTKRKNEKMLSDMGVKREALKQRISHRCPCAFQSQSLPSGALPANKLTPPIKSICCQDVK